MKRLYVCIIMVAACGSETARSVGELAGQSDPGLQLRRVLVIDDIPFGRIGGIAVDDHRRIYVADVQLQEISVIDSTGAVAARFGRPGRGPGEFAGLRGALAWSAGSLYAADWRSARITVFDESGRVSATRSWPAGTPVPERLLVGGDIVYAMAIVRRSLPQLTVDRPPPPPEPAEIRYFAIGPDGSATPIEVFNQTRVIHRNVFCRAADRSVVHPINLPFTRRGPLDAFLPTGHLVLGTANADRLDILEPASGAVERTIRIDIPPVPLGNEDWERQPEIRELRALEKQVGGRLENLGGGPCPVETSRPEFLPLLHTAISDEQGRLWVEGSRPGGYQLTVVSSDGSLLGVADMPDRDGDVTPHVRGDRLYVVVTDSDGVQSIHVYASTFPNTPPGGT
jgi:hypothetical protein